MLKTFILYVCIMELFKQATVVIAIPVVPPKIFVPVKAPDSIQGVDLHVDSWDLSLPTF